MVGKKAVAPVNKKQPVPVDIKSKGAVKKQNAGVVEAADPKNSKKVKRGTMHPMYREITVVQTDGAAFKTRSSYKNDTLKLDIDIKTHPAWTREANYINVKDSEVAKFNSRFAGLGFGLKKS